MAKAARTLCDRCEHRVVAGEPFCRTCGCPTAWASHDERVAWEVAQYRHISATAPIGVAYENGSGTATSVATKPRERRGVRLFSRRAHAPQLAAPKPKRVEPPEPILKAVPAEPIAEPIAEPVVKPVAKLVVEPAPKAKRAPAVRPKKADAEPAADTPATVMAMRMLNARVKELDAKIQELEGEIDTLRDAKRPRR